MSTKADPAAAREALLQGTLDLLVLRVLALGAHHGHGIALAIEARSGDTLLVDHGSLEVFLSVLVADRAGDDGGAGLNRQAGDCGHRQKKAQYFLRCLTK